MAGDELAPFGALPGIAFALGVRCDVVLGDCPGGRPLGVPALGLPLVTSDGFAGSGLLGVCARAGTAMVSAKAAADASKVFRMIVSLL
jgi:hypothetical protein